MYAFQVVPKIREIAKRHEKVVDAILANQAENIRLEADRLLVQGEEILRNLEEKKKTKEMIYEKCRTEADQEKLDMTMYQNDNMSPSNIGDEESFDDHYFPWPK